MTMLDELIAEWAQKREAWLQRSQAAADLEQWNESERHLGRAVVVGDCAADLARLRPLVDAAVRVALARCRYHAGPSAQRHAETMQALDALCALLPD